MNQRLEVLDSLRGLAALTVVIYHFTYRYYELYPHESKLFFSFYEGKYGVQAFFIISGFVIFMTLNKINKPLDFIVSRFSRLYPIYWFCVILTFIIVSLFGLQGREVTLFEMILNLTMIPSQFGLPFVDGVYWTLLYELKFYFWIFIVFILGKLKDIEKIILVFLLLSLLIHIFQSQNTLLYKVLVQLFIINFMPYFICGIIFYKIYLKEQTKLTYFNLILAFILCILFNNYDNGQIIIPIIFIVFSLFSVNKLNWFSNKLLVYLGTISYSLYLLHQNIGYILLNYFYSLKIIPIISFIFTLVLIFILSSIVTYIVEKKSTKYFKLLYKKNEKTITEYLNKKKLLKFLANEKT